jgi:integrase
LSTWLEVIEFAHRLHEVVGAENQLRKKSGPFRHFLSGVLLDLGASPQVAPAQLRHSDPRITLGVYSHVIGRSQREAVEKVAELLRPDAPKESAPEEWLQ